MIQAQGIIFKMVVYKFINFLTTPQTIFCLIIIKPCYQVEESRHEKSQARLKEKIKKLEEKAVGDKPWQMGGEVAAPVRSHNFHCRNNTLTENPNL